MGEGSVSQWALDFMLQLLGSQPSQLAPNFSLNSSPEEEEGQQDHNQRLDSQPSQPLPSFSLNSSPEGETPVEEPEEDAVGEMDYFAADGDEDADLYSEDDCNLDDQQEMELNDSNPELDSQNAESQDVILTPCPSESSTEGIVVLL